MAPSVKKEQFIGSGDGLAAPIAIVRAPKNDFYVSSVISGVIDEYDANGALRSHHPATARRRDPR